MICKAELYIELDVKDVQEGENLIKEMFRKNKQDRGNFNGGFITYSTIQFIGEAK